MLRRLALYSGGVLGLLLISSSLHAQPASGVTDTTIEGVLEGLRLRFDKVKDGYSFKLSDRPVTLANVQRGSKLLIKASFAAPDARLETLNGYNEEMAVTTRAVRYAKEGVVLEAGLDCRAGVNEAGLRQFIGGFGQDIREFEQFLARASGKVPGKKPAEGAGGGEKPTVGGKPQVAFKPLPIPLTVTPGTDDRDLEIHFPTQGAEASETAWKIVWDMETGAQAVEQGIKIGKGKFPKLFKIKKAYYRPGPKAEWLQVLEDAHPQEFYVPYFFQSTRFFDLRDVGSYVQLLPREGGLHSQLLGKDRRVMAEVRDRGVVYKHGSTSRRGEELVLWANFQAGNYTYLVEFCFHDDGTICFKHAPTGYNFFAHFDAGSHMHNVLWRIGVKLAPAGNGKLNNQVSLISLPYDPKKLGTDGKLDIKPIETECFQDWEAKEFTRVRVTNPGVSIYPKEAKERLPIAYDLVPVTQGQARHYRNKDEAFTLHDFWVTRPDSPEKMYIKLPEYFAKQTESVSLEGSDGVVLWHMSSALHVPRGEDGIVGGNNLNNGQALVYWTLVELRPRNLFTRTPLYRRDK
jgi:primary-amine oxidase